MTTYPVIGSLYDIDSTYNRPDICYSTNDGCFVVFYPYNAGLGARVYAKTITVSGTALTLSARAEVSPHAFSNTYNCHACYDAVNNCFVIGYVHESDAKLYLRKVTLSGGSFSSGNHIEVSAVGGSAASVYRRVFVPDPDSEKIVLYYRKESDGTLHCVVSDASGADVSIGSDTNLGAIVDFAACYDIDNQKHVIVYASGGELKCKIGTMTGGVISFSSELTADTSCTTASGWFISCAYDEQSQSVVAMHRMVTNFIRVNSFKIGTGAITENCYDDVAIAVASHLTTKAAYDATIKKVVVTYGESDSKLYGTTAIVGSGTVSLDTSSVLSTTVDSSSALVYGSAAEGTVVCGFWWTNNTVKDSVFFTQMYSPAPTAWWTNFSGQSEIIV